jgi:hypothetical protein
MIMMMTWDVMRDASRARKRETVRPIDGETDYDNETDSESESATDSKYRGR